MNSARVREALCKTDTHLVHRPSCECGDVTVSNIHPRQRKSLHVTIVGGQCFHSVLGPELTPCVSISCSADAPAINIRVPVSQPADSRRLVNMVSCARGT